MPNQPPSTGMPEALAHAMGLWPTVADLPKSLQTQVHVCPNFDLEDHLRTILVENPFVPPSGCPINRLPTELLAHIFHLGTYEEDEEDEDYDDESYDEDEDDDEDVVLDDEDEDFEDEEDEDEDGWSWDSIPKAPRGDHVRVHPKGPPGTFEEPEMQKTPRRGELDLPFQVLVSHVCKNWRAVAIESPALWTCVTFTEGAPFERSRTYIKRSQNLAIDIHINCTLSDDDNSGSDEDHDSCHHPFIFFTKADVATILDITIPLVGRWRLLEVTVNMYEYMHLVLSRLATECPSAPNLEVLELYHYEDAEEYDRFEPVHLNQSFIPFNGIAPKLKIVALWGVHIGWSAPLLSGLVDLELAYHAKDVRPSWADFSRILEESPNIETLTLSLSGPAGQPSTDWPDTPIELPSLKNLVLAYHEPDYVCSLIRLLWIPNVTSLALDFDSGDYTSLAKELAASQTSPDSGHKGKSIFANLESLKLSGLPCDLATVDTIYEQLGNVKHLNLNCVFLDEIFFTKLAAPSGEATSAATRTVPSPQSIYCPLLEVITTTGIDGWKMCDFVKRRRECGMPIKEVFMSEEDKVGTWEQEWLRHNVENFSYFEPSDSEDDVEVFEEDMGEDEDMV